MGSSTGLVGRPGHRRGIQRRKGRDIDAAYEDGIAAT